MSDDTVVRFRKPDAVRDALTEVLREGAQRLLKQAVQAELEEFLAARAELCDEHGRATVVRNGHLPEGEVLTGIGPVAVQVPEVRSRTDEPVVLRSSLVPPYVQERESGAAVAVPARDFHRADAGGTVGVARRGSGGWQPGARRRGDLPPPEGLPASGEGARRSAVRRWCRTQRGSTQQSRRLINMFVH